MESSDDGQTVCPSQGPGGQGHVWEHDGRSGQNLQKPWVTQAGISQKAALTARRLGIRAGTKAEKIHSLLSLNRGEQIISFSINSLPSS